MNKKIILGIVCALAIAGVAGIGVMKALNGTDDLVFVGPFTGNVELDAADPVGGTAKAQISESVAGEGYDTLTITDVGPAGDASDFNDGIYAVSGTLTLKGTTGSYTTGAYGLMTVSTSEGATTVSPIVLTLDKPLTTAQATDTGLTAATTLNDGSVLSFTDGKATTVDLKKEAATPATIISGTLSLNDIGGAMKAVENSTGLTNPTLSVAAASYLTDSDTVSTAGVYRAANHTFYLRNSNDSGVAHVEIPYGNAGDVPLVFKGTSSDGIAVYRPSNTTVYLDSNNDGVAEASLKLTLQEGDVVLGGTYSGTTIESVVYRPSTRAFYTDTNGDGALAETPVVFGNPGDVPFFDGSNIGVYRESNQTIYVDSDLDGVANSSSTLAFAKAGDIPVYDGTNYGLYRPITATFTFRVGGNDVSFVYGLPGDSPLVGNWGVSYWKTYEY